MEKKTFYISTPIYYPSDKLHIGHSYTTVAADTISRYKRIKGFDVMFLTGTDEHGQKIERKAIEKGVTPQAYVGEIVDGIKKLWDLFCISNDKFIRTTDDYHVAAVQKIFKALYDKGDIYKSEYEGWYCTPCESFWTETQLQEGKCPDCARAVERTKEESYFFKLSKYQDRLLEHIENNPDFIQPVSRKNEMINNFIKPGLQDLCVSRTTFSWGVPVTFDDKHIVYVWIDALSNYITALGYGSENTDLYDKFWPAQVHLVGKEIVRFHTIIWPAILMALDLPLPKQIYGHGWLLLDGGRMAKSKGNVVDPVILINKYGVDAIRYFLLREIPFGSDGSFSNEALINRINNDLANDLGNLLSRTVAMIEKYFGGTIPSDKQAGDFDDSLKETVLTAAANVDELIEKFQFSNALAEIWKGVGRANKYIDETAPWILAKDEANNKRLAGVMYNLAETLRITAVLIEPFIPGTSEKIKEQLGLADNKQSTDWESAKQWDGTPNGIRVKKGEIIFPRIDVQKDLAEMDKILEETMVKAAVQIDTKEQTIPEFKAEVRIEDFSKLDLRVARVLECEKVEGSDKLLKFKLDLGRETRQVVSGIAKYYEPQKLVGKQVIMIANLKPVKIRGVESQGMILSACDDANNQLKVSTVEGDIANGAEVL